MVYAGHLSCYIRQEETEIFNAYDFLLTGVDVSLLHTASQQVIISMAVIG